jgi:hypothetical protein
MGSIEHINLVCLLNNRCPVFVPAECPILLPFGIRPAEPEVLVFWCLRSPLTANWREESD